MKFLLDTQVLLWIFGEPERLAAATNQVLADQDNPVFVSVVALWQTVVKRRAEKLEADIPSIAARMTPASTIRPLSTMRDHLIMVNSLAIYPKHRDRFDHLIIAQAMSKGLTLVTQKQNATLYPVRVMSP